MSGRHQPVEGADSPGQTGLEPPLDQHELEPERATAETVTRLFDLIDDRRAPMEVRAGAIAIVWRLKLELERRLRLSKDELARHMVKARIRQMGPIALGSRAIEVAWPCNDPENWTDDGVQYALDELYSNPLMHDYVRHVPDHYEIDTAALGAGVAAGSANALELHRNMKANGWRTERDRVPALTLKEGKK